MLLSLEKPKKRDCVFRGQYFSSEELRDRVKWCVIIKMTCQRTKCHGGPECHLFGPRAASSRCPPDSKRTGMELLCPSAWWGVNEAGLICSPPVSQRTHYRPCQIQWEAGRRVTQGPLLSTQWVILKMAQYYCCTENGKAFFQLYNRKIALCSDTSFAHQAWWEEMCKILNPTLWICERPHQKEK